MSSFAFPFGGPFGGDDDVLTPLELYDPVPGNRGLRGPATILLHLEEPDGVLPSDAAENLEDLQADTGLAPTAMPASTSAWTGRGRAFTGTEAVLAADRAGRDTLLQRDVTVQAILSLDIPELDTDVHTLIVRGLNDGTTSERYSMAVHFQRLSDTALVWWSHCDEAGVRHEGPAAEFTLLGAGKLFLLTTTRRWEASDRVVYRFYVDERGLDELADTAGVISGGTTGHTSIGARKDAATWDEFFLGTLDELAVYDFEMSPAEVRATWLRLYQHQPDGVLTLKGLAPPGAPWFKDPGNKIGRRMKVVGQGLGTAVATIDELREMFLPDKAPRDQLARWEGVYKVATRPRDSLDRRRERLLAITGRDEGFSFPSVKAALLDLLDVADPNDLEIYEGQNLVEDDFATLEDERWTLGDLGTWSIVSGEAKIHVPAATDIRWETNAWGAHMRTSVDLGDEHLVSLAQVKVASYALPQSAGVGLLLCNRRENRGIWAGIYNDAGTVKFAWRRVAAGVADAVQVLGAVGGLPMWLRLRKHPDPTIVVANTYQLLTSDVGTAPEDFSAPTNIASAMPDADWVGLGVFGSASSTAIDLDVTFDDFLAFAEGGAWPHYWYVYRNPALGGAPDLVGAQALLQRIKPAHTHAAVVTSKSLLADNPADGLVGRGPMGILHP